jgi:5-methylcytosine-specific restriction protein A
MSDERDEIYEEEDDFDSDFEDLDNEEDVEESDGDEDDFDDFSDDSEEESDDFDDFSDDSDETSEDESDNFDDFSDDSEEVLEESNEFESEPIQEDIEPERIAPDNMFETMHVNEEDIMSADERVRNMLKLTSDAYTREFKRINIRQIGFTDPVKKGRAETMTGLTQSIKDFGVLDPIDVMTVQDPDDDYKYILIAGLRRVFGALKNGQEEIDAIVWDFRDKDQGSDLALYLGLILNRTQRRNWGEIWHLYQVLELQSAITPGTLEYLLQLESGDAMKLKDVMLCTYDEVKEALLSGEKNLDACYKMLAKLRKEEDKLAMEDSMGAEDSVEGAEDLASDNTGEAGQLSDQDVMELLEMADSIDDENIDDEDFGAMNQSAFEDEHQKVGDRHPVDPAIRQGTFQRDNFRCRCCGTGGAAFLATLVYHHAIPVHCGGADTIENGLTLCDSCHQTLHCAEKAGGKIAMTREQFDEYDDAEKTRIKKILKYAKIAVEAARRKGISREKIAEEANKSARHRMPGETLKETQIGFATANNE